MSHILFQNFKLFHHHIRISFAHEEQNAVKMKNTNKSDAENISERSQNAKSANANAFEKCTSFLVGFSFYSLARVRRLIALASCHSRKKMRYILFIPFG
jgi:hypothetical protein